MRNQTTNQTLKVEPRAASLEDILTRVVQALRELPVEPRTPLERQRAGGRLYPTHELVVDRIKKGLLQRPDLFPDVPQAAERGALLAERQARAGAWLALRDQLLAFADICQDGAQKEQALAVYESEEVAERVLGGLRQREERPGLDHGARLGALFMGLVWRQESMKRRGRPARRAATPQEEQTPRQAQAAAARKQERRAATWALFKRWMGRR